jgi:tRNA1Val (adenine37-N6)-methyltransferase
VLAASLRGLPAGSLVFDLGTGTGDALLEALHRNPGCVWAGLDPREKALAELMRRGRREGSRVFAVCSRVEDVPSLFREGCADAVMANPPYGTGGSERPSPDGDRLLSRSGHDTLLYAFLRAASHLLRPGGTLLTVNRPRNLARVLTGCSAFDLGVEWIRPVGDRDRPASMVLVCAVKSSGREMMILPALSAGEITGRS